MAFNPGAAPVPNSYECQNCGAKLPAPSAEGTQTCLYCQAVYHVQREAANPQGFTIVFGSGATQFGSAPPSFGSYATPSTQALDAMVNAGVKTAKWSLMIGLIVTFVIIAAVAVPLYFAFKDGFSGFTSSTGGVNVPGADGIDFTFSENGAVLLPGEPNAPAQVLQVGSQYDQVAKASKSSLAKFDLGGKKVSWKAKPFDEIGFSRPMVVDGTNVYVADGAKVRAIKLSDGTDVWTGPLADKISTSCQDCMYLVGTKIVVRTDDGQIQALDTATGASSWNRKVSDIRARPIGAGDKVLVLDGSIGEYTLTILNLADGAELGTINPACASPSGSAADLGTDSQVIAAPLENAVYVGFGNYNSCWQKYDLANPGTPVMSAYVDKAYLNSESSIPVIAEGKIVWGERSSGAAVGVVDIASSTGQLIAAEENMQFSIAGVTGGKAIVRAKNTRGTAKLSVRAIDLASGAQVWEKSLGEADSLDPPDESPSDILSDGTSKVSMRVTADGKVTVLTVTGASTDTTAKAETVDAATGVTVGSPSAVSLGKPSGSNEAALIGWSGSRVTFLTAKKMLTFDAADGTQVASLP